MVRRIFAIVLIVLGLGTIGAAVASGTIWRPDDQVTLTLPSTPDVPLVITAPGVLNAVDNHVDVTLVGATPETPIVLAMASERDVRAWVGDAQHWEITGLADWETLTYIDSRDEVEDPSASESATEESSESSTEESSASGDASEEPSESESPSEAASETESASEDATATEEPTEPAQEATVPNPAGADLWIEQATGTGELTYSWTAVPGRWMMLVAADGTEPAPQVQLTWTREVTTPLVQPGIILGSVITLLGIGLLTVQLLADVERRRARRAAAAAADAPEVAVVAAGDGDGEEPDRPLTRREIRLAEARRSGKAAKAPSEETQVIPAIPDTDVTPEETSETSSSPDVELDAWVRSGAASPLLHEGERVSPDDLGLETIEGETAEGEPAGSASEKPTPAVDEAPVPAEKGRREPFWRRRRQEAAPAADVEEPVAETEQPQPAADADVPTAMSGDTEQIPAIQADDASPQASGASWRHAWGLDADTSDSKEDER